MFAQRSVTKADRTIRAFLSVLFVLSLLVGMPTANVSAEQANAPRAAINYTQFAMLTATDSGTNAHFGTALAIDEDVAVVGVPDASVGNNNGQGAVYIYYRDQGGTDKWGQVQRIVSSSGESGDHFGNAVAISGNTIVVGAKDAAKPGASKVFSAGVAYIFQRNTTTGVWSETQVLSASDAQKNDRFGTAVAIHDNVVFAGSPYEDPQGGSNNSGSAYLFVRPAADAPFQQVQKFSANPTGTVADKYGAAMALDATTLIVGAPMMKLTNQGQGMTYVYSYYKDANGNYQFNKTAELKIDTGLAGDNFGKSVALSNKILAIGAPSTNTNPTGGAAYLYKRNDAGQWIQIRKETPQPAQMGNLFGTSVSLDGDLLAVGAPGELVNGQTSAGAVYLFARDQDGPNTWNQVGAMSVTDGSAVANDRFGLTAGISGTTILGGVPGKSLTLSGQGAVYVMRVNFQLEIDLNGPASSIDYYTGFTEGSDPVSITDPAAFITNTGSSQLDKMVVSIDNLLDAGEEFLSATASGAIAQSNIQYEAQTGLLTVDPAGKAPMTDFIAVLRTVKYANTSQNPNPLDRIVRFWVTDGIVENMQEPASYIVINPVNDAPAVTPQTADFFTAMGTPLEMNDSLTLSDPDAGINYIQVTLGVNSGALTLDSLTGLTFTNGDGVDDAAMTFTATLVDANAALQHIVFTPAAQMAGQVEFNVTVDDLGSTGSGGALTASAIYNITVFDPSTNNPPSDISPLSAEVREDASVGTVVAAFTVTDPDAGDVITLSLVSGEGCTQNPPFALQGSTLVTSTSLNYESSPSYALCVQAKDRVGATLTKTVTVSVLNVNESPVNHLPAAQAVNEDTPLNLTTITVSDVDAGQNPLKVNLAVVHGQLTLKDATGVTVTGSGAALTITGGQSAINTAFGKGLVYQPTANYYGAETLTMTTSDQGATGLDGAKSVKNTLAITVKSVKDASTVVILGTNPDKPRMNAPFIINFRVTSSAGTPTGSVTVTAIVNGSNVTCKGTLNASGSGSCTMSIPQNGDFNFTAAYAGDVNFLASTSKPYLYEVLPYATYFTMTIKP